MHSELLSIHPPISLPGWWWLVVIALVAAGLGMLILGIARWRALAPLAVVDDDSLARLRDEALRDVRAAASSPIEPNLACQRMVRTARRFVGTASNALTDHASTRQLQLAARRDPRLSPLLHLVESTLQVCYLHAEADDVVATAHHAEQVITRWR